MPPDTAVAQLSDDCFAFGGALMRLEEALAILRDRSVPVAGMEQVSLRDAGGRVLAEAVVAGRAVPPHDNSAVDGYAVYFDDLSDGAETILPVVGRAAAGHPLDGPMARGGAVRIFTGARMPDGPEGAPGPDTVLMQEDCRADAQDRVAIPSGIKRGANRRAAGEDIAEGAEILSAGRRLRPQDLGLAASVGRTALSVRRPLRVAVFSTGDELRDPGQETPSGCVYDANRYTLMGLLGTLGASVTDLGILPDRRETIREGLEQAARDHDLVLTSGGMSTGEEDHVKAALEAIGSLHFWRLAIKPGRPIALGQVGRVPFIGLPGNPVAVMVTFLKVARPLILALSGCAEPEPALFRVRADFAHRKKPERREWVRARLVATGDGTLVARKYPRDGAGILSSMVESDGLVELAEDVTRLEAGAMVDFLPFSEVRL